jgi:hypothetical protein
VDSHEKQEFRPSSDRAPNDEEVVSSQQDQPDLAVFGGKVDVTPWTGWWFKTCFFQILGMSSSQLTSCPSFFRGVLVYHQPEKLNHV